MPDAPAPTYDSHGNLVAEWKVTIRYDALRDVLEVHQAQEAGPYTKARRHTDVYAPHEVEALLASIGTMVRTLGARRLF